MTVIQQTVCNGQGCKNIKQQSNHWFVMREYDTTVFEVMMMADTPPSPGDQHICGSKCLHGELERWIAENAVVAEVAEVREG